MSASPAAIAPIRPISWVDLLEEKRLIKEYADECADPGIGVIDPSRPAYGALAFAGLLRCLGAYADDGRLVGFATIMTSLLPHYGKQMAVVESLFVSAPYRSAGLGTELIRAVEDYARESGSVGVLYSALPDSRLERLFEMKGYLRTSAVFYRSV